MYAAVCQEGNAQVVAFHDGKTQPLEPAACKPDAGSVVLPFQGKAPVESFEVDGLSLPEQDSLHCLPDGCGGLLGRQGVDAVCVPVLLHGDPRMELVLTEAVFRTQVRKARANACAFLFSFRGIPFAGMVFFHQGAVPLILPHATETLPCMFYQAVVHQEPVIEPVI